MLVGTLADTVKKTFEESVDELLGDSIGNAIQTVFVWMERDMDGVMTYGVFISRRITRKVMKALNDLVVPEWRLAKFAWLMCEKVAVTDCSEEPSPTNCELFGMMIRLRPVTTISTLEFAAFRHALERDNALMRSKALQLEKLFIGVQLQVVQCRSASDARSIEYLQEEVALLSAQVGKLASPPMHWVRNCESGVVHRPIIWSLDVPPSMWCTGCGWAFGKGNVEKVQSLPSQCSMLCGCCRPGCYRVAVGEARLALVGVRCRGRLLGGAIANHSELFEMMIRLRPG